MAPNDRGVARILSLTLAAVLAIGCTTGGTSTNSAGPSPTTAPPSPSPSATPSPSPTPLPSPTASPFSFDVVPAEDPAAVRAAIPGAWVCFLGVLNAKDLAAGPVTIAATAKLAKVRAIVQPTVEAPIAEVWVVPDASSVEATASVTFTATRGSVVRTVTRSLPVFPMADERATDARPHFEWWVAWLAAKHPELGITAKTQWTPRFVSTLLVVSHYAYFSDQWELTVAWHNMIPPYDWTEIHLRRRGTEAVPSIAYRQDSMKGATEPHPVTPPETPVR